MSNLENTVNDVIVSFINDEVLFTALDVSNKVKELVPSARHRDIRDIVRQAWNNSIEPSGYARTPITVTLSNGSSAQAILYHPLSDSWDLDNKYNNQKRTQVSTKPASNSAATPVAVGTSTVSVATDGSVTITDNLSSPVATPSVVPAPVVPPVAVPPVVAKPMREVWQRMFDSQPSLFPRK